MSEDSELIALIDVIYAAVLDGDLWPTVLTKLADATGALQAVIGTLDRRTDTYASISRRADPDLEASYKNYWAFHNPIWTKTTVQPAGEVFSLDTLMPREDFVKTPIFNEWWKAADYGLEMLLANLPVEDSLSSLICVINARGNDALTSEQTRVFETAARHVSRAVRVHRQLWTLDLMHRAGAVRKLAPGSHPGRRRGADSARNGRWARTQGWLPRQHGRRGHIATADRLLRARGWSAARAARRRTRSPARPKSPVPPCNGDAASIQRPGYRDPLARIAPARGYCHGG
jgi:hypothetical protein